LTVDAENVLRIEVYDRLGRRVAVFDNTNSIDISSLAAGSYTLRISFAQGKTVRRVIKR
jgi:hypothetical protein